MEKRKHFSMIREFRLADFFTLANGFAGTASVLATLRYVAGGEPAFLWWAFGLLPVAVLLDFADGRIARWRRKASELGQELDSLADLVSFGVAPACIAFAIGMRGGWDAAVLVYFVGCGISRLARYNVTASAMAGDGGKVPYYEGTPIPTSLAIVLVLAVLHGRGLTGPDLPLGSVGLGPFALHPLVLLYAMSGSLMISKTLRIPKP